MPSHRTKAVANQFLSINRQSNIGLNPDILQMLIYFAHGWYLAIKNEPLLEEDIEADGNGIMIQSIRDSLTAYGHEKITGRLSEYDSKQEAWIEPELDNGDSATEIIKRVWEVYITQPEGDLRQQTMGFGTPWYQVWNNGKESMPINNQIVKEYFMTLAQDKKQSAKGKTISPSDIKLDDNIKSSQAARNTADDLEKYNKSLHGLLTDKKQTKWKKIKNYAVLWNPGKRRGIVKIALEDEVDYKLVVKSVAELTCITDVLRFEKNIYYNIVSGSIASGWVHTREHHSQK